MNTGLLFTWNIPFATAYPVIAIAANSAAKILLRVWFGKLAASRSDCVPVDCFFAFCLLYSESPISRSQVSALLNNCNRCY